MKNDITALGEILIDFTPCGVSEAGMKIFEQNPGGAPANVLASACRLGRKTAFIGKVGKDMHGDFLIHTLKQAGIDTSGIVQAEDVFTTLAFVSLSETGERDFSFARKPGADTCLTADEIDKDIVRSSAIFHFGSLSLTDEPARTATFDAVKTAKDAGAIISYDPNYRALLWRDKGEAMRRMRAPLPMVDIIKISDEETELLTGIANPEEAAKALVKSGIYCAVVTLGANGAVAATKDGVITVDSFKTAVRDTTGAGDAFWGAFLTKLSESGLKPAELTVQHAQEFACFACAAASLCVEKRGAIPAMPDKSAVLKRMQED